MQSSNDFFPCFQGRTWRPDAEVRNDLESNLVVLRLDSPHIGPTIGLIHQTGVLLDSQIHGDPSAQMVEFNSVLSRA
jgi:hypothetical protein